MSVLEIGRVQVDPPEQFPIDHLSASSIDLFQRCPMSWKHKHIDKLPDRSTGKMTAGSAAGAALAQHYGHQLEAGEGFSTERLLDEFSKGLAQRQRDEDIDWEGESPGEIKDTTIGALTVYHRHVAPDVRPLAVEREFELVWEDCPFTLIGYLDLEEADGAVGDAKTSGSKWYQAKADAQLQPDIYMGARRAEGWPAPEFRYHNLVRGKTKQTAQILTTKRTEAQLDRLTFKVFSIARRIEFSWLNDIWQGPGPDSAWMCRGCAHASGCPWRLGS